MAAVPAGTSNTHVLTLASHVAGITGGPHFDEQQRQIMRSDITTLVAAALLGGLPAQGDTVHGQVLDVFGQPVEGARIESGWSVERSALTPQDTEKSGQKGVVSDEEGRCLGIVAIHGGTVASLRALDEGLVLAGDRHLEVVQDLPFPTLLDASHETLNAWEITRYPTLLLIDPMGTLVESFVGALAMHELREETSRLGLHPRDSSMERALLRSIDPLLNRR